MTDNFLQALRDVPLDIDKAFSTMNPFVRLHVHGRYKNNGHEQTEKSKNDFDFFEIATDGDDTVYGVYRENGDSPINDLTLMNITEFYEKSNHGYEITIDKDFKTKYLSDCLKEG